MTTTDPTAVTGTTGSARSAAARPQALPKNLDQG